MVTEEHHGQVVTQYRKAKKWSQEDLAGALLGIPAALLGLEIEQEQAQQTPVAINSDRMAFFEEEMATRWDMYHIGGTMRASRGLDMWLNEIERFARSAQYTVWHGRGLALLSMSYQLQCCMSRDLMIYDAAHKALKKGYHIAQELGDVELIGSAMTREGITLVQQERPVEAIRVLSASLDVIKNAGLPKLRGYTLQALSEAYAKTGQSQQCWQCISLAERLLEREEVSHERYEARFNASSLAGQKGVNAVLLQDYERAIALIDKSLVNYDMTVLRGRARLFAQKAEAYHGLSIIDASTSIAEDALQLGRSVGSNKTIARVAKLHASMTNSRYGKEKSVARLGALLALQK